MSVLDEQVKIGLMWPKTGPQSWAGLECIEAAHGTVAMLEDEGRIPPGGVQLLEGDANSVDASLEVAKRHLEDGAHLLHGTIMSDWVVPAAQVAADAGVLYWEAVAASEDITAIGLKNFFRVNVNCSRYARDMARFVASELAEPIGVETPDLRVCVVYQAASFTRSLADELRDELVRLGAAVPVHAEVDPAAESFAGVIDTIAAADPHVVVASTFGGPTPGLYRESIERGFNPPAWLGTGSWALEQKVESLGPLLDGVFAAGTPHLAAMSDSGLTEGGQARFRAWKQRTSIPHNYRTAVDRDLSVVALEILLTEVLPYVDDWSLDTLRQRILSVDLPLGSGLLGYGARFTETGDNERSFTAVMQWQGGRLETVSPQMIATAPIQPPAPR